MRSWHSRASLLAGCAAVLIAIPALSQDRGRPESLLPPGFGDPQTLPPPEKATPVPRPPRQDTPRPTRITPRRPMPPPSRWPRRRMAPRPPPRGSRRCPLDTSLLPRPTNYFTVPRGLERPTDLVGPLLPGNFGLAQDAFGQTNGFLLRAIMRRVAAPLASRWASIVLRRALLSRVPAPAGVHPVDWVAERAALLLKMGEADAARALVQAVDVEQYTPRMIEAASETALGHRRSRRALPPGRPGAKHVAGPGLAARRRHVRRARGRGGAGRRDHRPAARAATARASTCSSPRRWSEPARRPAAPPSSTGRELARSRPWRFGLASATGAAIPDSLINNAGPRIQAWLARAPMVPLEQRLRAASVAASIGVLLLAQPRRDLQPRTGPHRSCGGGRHGRRAAAQRLGGAGARPPAGRDAQSLDRERGPRRAAGPPDPHRRRGGANPCVRRLSGRRSQPHRLDAERRHGRRSRALGRCGRGERLLRQGLGAARARRAAARRFRRLRRAFPPSSAPTTAAAGSAARCWSRGWPGLGRISMDQAASSGFRPGAGDIWTQAIDRAAQERAPGIGGPARRGRLADRRTGAACRPIICSASCGRCTRSAWTSRRG